MIKRVKNLRSSAMLSQNEYRGYIESFESETIRGIGTMVILKIIANAGENGIYGYRILKDLRKETQKMLVIEEGRMYPMLSKLELQNMVIKEIKMEGRRKRKYYTLTEQGKKTLHHLEGVFLAILKSISNLMCFHVESTKSNTIVCPNCNNLIELVGEEINYCEICGNNITELVEN